MQRLFINSDQLSGNKIVINEETFHHLINVCRLKIGDSLEAVVDQEKILLLKVLNIENSNSICIEIHDQWAVNPIRPYKIHLIQSLPKQDKFTEICRMCTELGVNTISPIVSEYSSVNEISENKFKRAKNTILSAAKQSKQSSIPVLNSVNNLSDCLVQFSNTKYLKLIAYENASQQLNQLEFAIPNDLVIAIGPEGGFSPGDMALFKQYGFYDFSLGSHILRTEHAGFASICFFDGYIQSKNKS
ncbi:MAG: RsmE family RNA methyltransferase [Candidatus Margulisiibacteriota bacterium]